MMQSQDDTFRRKEAIRAEARARRARQPQRDELSRRIGERLLALPEYRRAAAVMTYLDFGAEVHTRPLLPRLWAAGKHVVIPYCKGESLELFRLESLDELEPGTLGILEPVDSFRGRADRAFDPAELDLLFVPGVAFDRRGGRLGHGKGFYDRFLRRVSPRAALVGLAFECQVFPEVPMLEHDAYMHKVVTEAAVYLRE